MHSRIISVHEYSLKADADEEEFLKALRRAEQDGLLNLPGLLEHYLLKGIRGSRAGRFAAVWIYDNREAWEKLWGPMEAPWGKEKYPENWKMWEIQVLAPFLDRDPDRITYTAYAEF